jgi:hypothetical protein
VDQLAPQAFMWFNEDSPRSNNQHNLSLAARQLYGRVI